MAKRKPKEEPSNDVAIKKPVKSHSPQIKIKDGELVLPKDKDLERFCIQLQETTGLNWPAPAEMLSDILNVGCLTKDGKCKGEGRINYALALMHDIKPQNALETMLANQIVSTYRVSVDMLKRAMFEDQTIDGVDRNINRATKLQRTFISLIDSLQKIRGKGQQKMTVEHVHVHEGGQAVVGTINQGGAKGER